MVNRVLNNSARRRILFTGFLFLGFLGCKDQGVLPPAPTTVQSFSTVLDTLFTFPRDSVLVRISGGIPPYSIQNISSPTILTCRISDSTLTVLPASQGLVVAQISDASSPANQFQLPVVISAPVSFSASIQPIFETPYGCSGTIGGCHGGLAGLFLDNPTVSYQNLVEVPSQSTSFFGLKRVSPRDPAHSVLYLRLVSNDPSVSMPEGRTAPFNPIYLANVRTWILQGAHLN